MSPSLSTMGINFAVAPEFGSCTDAFAGNPVHLRKLEATTTQLFLHPHQPIPTLLVPCRCGCPAGSAFWWESRRAPAFSLRSMPGELWFQLLCCLLFGYSASFALDVSASPDVSVVLTIQITRNSKIESAKNKKKASDLNASSATSP